MKKILFITILFLYLSSHSSEVLSLEEAKNFALKKNLEYLSEQEDYETTKWQSISSFSELFPSGSFLVSQSLQEPGITNSSTGVSFDEMNSQLMRLSFSQTIFSGGKKFLPYRISNYSKKIASLSLKDKKLEVINSIEDLYFSALEAVSLLDIVKDQVKFAEDNLSIAEIKFNLGAISKGDLLKFKSDHASTLTEMIQYETLYSISIQNIQNALNRTEEFELVPIKNHSDNQLLKNLQSIDIDDIGKLVIEYTKIGIEENYSLKTMKLTKKIADSTLLLSAGNFFPIIQANFSKNWSKAWNENESSNDYSFIDSQEIGISASIPILPVVNNAASYLAAKHEQRKSIYSLQNTENAINLSIKSKVLQWISSAKAMNQAEIAKQYSEEMYAQMQERFKNGMISSTEFLDAGVMLKNAKLNFSKNLYAYYKAKSSLMRALSIDNENQLNEVVYRIREK